MILAVACDKNTSQGPVDERVSFKTGWLWPLVVRSSFGAGQGQCDHYQRVVIHLPGADILESVKRELEARARPLHELDVELLAEEPPDEDQAIPY